MGLADVERALGTVGAWSNAHSPKTLCISRTALLTPRVLSEAVGLVPHQFVSAQTQSDSTEVSEKRKTSEAEIPSQRAQADSSSSEAGKISFTQAGVDSFVSQNKQSIL